MNQCKNEARTMDFMDKITLIEEWPGGTCIHPYLQTWLIAYIRKRNKKRFKGLEGLPRSMNAITEEQVRTGWATFAEGRMTKRI